MVNIFHVPVTVTIKISVYMLYENQIKLNEDGGIIRSYKAHVQGSFINNKISLNQMKPVLFRQNNK